MNATALVFKLLEPILLHEPEKPLHFGEIHAVSVRTCAGFRFQLFRHLEFEEIPRSCRQIHSALRCDDHIVLNADTANPFEVGARFNRHDHSFLE